MIKALLRRTRRLLPALVAALILDTSAQELPDQQGLAAWAAESFPSRIAQGDFSAAAVAVVLEGEVLLAEQFGFYDPLARTPVQDHHQFMVGSLTKTLSGVILSLLVEQGRLPGIDTLVNPLMHRFQLAPPWGGQVNLAQLLSHSAGLESPGFGLTVGDQQEIPASSAYLQDKFAQVVREPGQGIVYSNFGAPIFGLAVEDQLGMRYDAVVQTLLLQPLGMADSRFEYDPRGGPTLVRAGIRDPSRPGEFTSTAPITVNDPVLAPSGSLQASARDMARYMNALLGQMPEVLSPAVIALSRKNLASNGDGMVTSGLGIFSEFWNENETVYHGGVISGFRSQMKLVPELGLGVFVSLAGGDSPFSGPGEGPGRIVDRLLLSILGPAQPVPTIELPREQLEPLVGDYWLELRAHTTAEKALALPRVWRVRMDDAGTLLVNGKAVDPISPTLFQQRETTGLPPARWSMTADRLGSRSSYASRTHGLANPMIIIPGLVACSAIMLTFLVHIRRRGALLASTALFAAPAIIFLGTLVVPQFMGVNIDLEMFEGDDWRLQWNTLGGWLAVAGTAFGCFLLASGRRSAHGAWLNRHLAVTVAASATFAGWFNYLNLI